jgi:plastocyanin
MGFEALGSRARSVAAGAAFAFVLAAIGPVTAASAVERVIAGPQPTTYLNPRVEIEPGEELRFLNADASAPHDVTSTDVGPGGQALFRSETVGAVTDVPVTGAELLPVGSYEYICSLHSFMEGTVVVRGEGGGGGAGGDSKAPSLKLRAPDQGIEEVLEAGKLKLRAKVDEPATVRVKATPKKGKPTVARARAALDRGKNKLAAKLTKKGKRLLRGTGRVKLELSARVADDAGNTRKVSKTLVLD